MAEPREQPEPDLRFSLANERTLLAYQRTAIALIGASIAVIHFFGDGGLVVLLAAALLLAGAVAAIGGYLRFRAVDVAMREGRPMPTGFSPHLFSLTMLLCLVIAAIYVVAKA